MKGKILTIKHLWGGVFAIAALMLGVSCVDGFDGNEQFETSVRNTTLVSPDAAGFKYTFVTTADGVEQLKVSWPVVHGAGGYQISVNDVTDAENTQSVVETTVVDGLTVQFEYADDRRYEFNVLTLGNEKLNNKGAEAPTLAYYTTGGESVAVPASNKDLGKFIADYLAANAESLAQKRAEDPNFEVAFDIEAGAEYTYDTPVDIGLQSIRLRNMSETNHTTIKVSTPIETQAGLRAKNINFDCADGISALIAFSDEPDASISTEALGYKNDGANQDGFIIEKPIILENCWVKNLTNSLIWGQKKNWSLRDFRILNCIIQLNNSGSATFLDLSGASNGLIKEMTIKNSTIYNLAENNSAYFIRFSNASNAQPQKIFGDSQKSITHRIEDCTIVRVFTAKDFANNMPTVNTMTDYVSNVLFCDVFRLYQYILNNHTRYTENNVMWYHKTSPQSNDYGGRTDSNGKPFTTLEEEKFFDPETLKELDFSQPNGGANFHANSAISSNIGDPRWR